MKNIARSLSRFSCVCFPTAWPLVADIQRSASDGKLHSIRISSSYFGWAGPNVGSNALADVCAELHSHGARNPDVTQYPDRVEGISRLETCEVCRGVALETQVDMC